MRKYHHGQESNGTRRGYYLVKDHDYHFISETVNPAALDRVASRVLSEKTGWEYWIAYSHGVDVKGKAAWSNCDHIDSFI